MKKYVSSFDIMDEKIFVKDIDAESEIELLKTENIATNVRIDKISEKKYVMISDSYGTGALSTPIVKSWPERVRDILGLTPGVNFFTKSAGSCGFGGVYKLLSPLTELAETMSVEIRSNITDVLVGGGANDYLSSDEAILAGIEVFMASCKTFYPNATITIICMGWFKGSANRTSMLNVYDVYNKGVKFGYRVFNNAYQVLQYKTCIQSDNVHPTDLGQERLSLFIVNSLLDGISKKPTMLFPLVLLGNTEKTIGVVTLDGDVANVTMYSNNFIFDTTTIGSNFSLIADTRCACMFGCDTNYAFSIRVPCIISHGGGSNSSAHVTLSFLLSGSASLCYARSGEYSNGVLVEYTGCTQLTFMACTNIIPISYL